MKILPITLGPACLYKNDVDLNKGRHRIKTLAYNLPSSKITVSLVNHDGQDGCV